MIAFATGMSPVMSRVPVIRERGGFTGMSPVMSCVSVICERDNFTGMNPVMSRAPVICERDSFTGMSLVAGTGQQAGIRSPSPQPDRWAAALPPETPDVRKPFFLKTDRNRKGDND